MWGRLRQYFVSGILTLTPFLISLYIIDRLFIWALSATSFLNGVFFGNHVPWRGISLFIALAIILLVGAVANQYVGRVVLKWVERGLARIPVWRGLYDGTKQVLTSVFDRSGKSFQRVVLVPGPHPESRLIAFQVGDGTLKDGKLSVFLPLSPPTAGIVAVYDPSVVEESGLTVEEALRVLLSAGTLTPRSEPRLVPSNDDGH